MRVLISAYACEPGKGSEPAAGWAWAKAAAIDHDVWVMTRANNRASIEHSSEYGELSSRLHFVYVDVPRWASWFKRGKRGIRLYYLLWQLQAGRVARRLHVRYAFDVAHHLTFANLWLPSHLAFADIPYVLGPVGGGVAVPRRLYPLLGPRGMVREEVLRIQRLCASLSPPTRRTWRNAAAVLAQNRESADVVRSRTLRAPLVSPNAIAAFNTIAGPYERPRTPDDGPLAVVAGRLVAWKGVALAIYAVAALPMWKLLVIGDGPDRARLTRLSRRVAPGRVRFAGRLPQDRLWNELSRAQAVLLPSLREEASFLLAEAATIGCYTVAVDRGGPAVLGRLWPGRVRLVSGSDTRSLIAGMTEALRSAHTSRSVWGASPCARELRSVLNEAYALASLTHAEDASPFPVPFGGGRGAR